MDIVTNTAIPEIFKVPLKEENCRSDSNIVMRHPKHGDLNVNIVDYHDHVGVQYVIVREYISHAGRRFYSPITVRVQDVEIVGLLDSTGRLREDHAALCRLASVREDYLGLR